MHIIFVILGYFRYFDVTECEWVTVFHCCIVRQMYKFSAVYVIYALPQSTLSDSRVIISMYHCPV